MDSTGTLIAMELRDYGRQHLPIATFYDSNDIAAGHNFEKEIHRQCGRKRDGCHSHGYLFRSTRGAVKRSSPPSVIGCPVLVVNAVTVGEERLFPYLGNAPSVRWFFIRRAAARS